MIKMLNENRNLPQEGLFWMINDEIVGITAEVPTKDYHYELEGKTHKNSWHLFSQNYLVDGKEVEWDYFPRGRVLVDHLPTVSDVFTGFIATIYNDKCLNNEMAKQKILEYFNLELPTVKIVSWQDANKIAGIEHYSCHNCR